MKQKLAKPWMTYRVLSALFLITCAGPAITGTDSATAQTPHATERDGQHDFDFELGKWNIHLKRRLRPLTGSNTWVEFNGTSATRKVWGGRAELEQFETDGAGGHIEGLTLRLYNPKTSQWSLYWANSNKGVVEVPQVGQFKDGVGEFYGWDTLDDKPILVRFIWSRTESNTPHFEQAFSADGGKTWEVNWITDQTRVADADQMASAPPAQVAQPTATITAVVDHDISSVEKQIVDVAQAMPEDKFNFSPESLNIPGDDYSGVRTFALQLKHVAASNYAIWSALTGDKFPKEFMGGNGPENLKTKAEIIHFLKGSFALGHKAAATLTTENMLQNPEGSQSTRLRLAEFGVAHAYDHYGQMVEYLRMNGIVPPASRANSD